VFKSEFLHAKCATESPLSLHSFRTSLWAFTSFAKHYWMSF